MKDTVRKVKNLFDRARADSQYAKLSVEYCVLEEWFSRKVQELSEGEQDRMWAFVNVSEAMNWRMLELIVDEKI